MSSWMLSGRLFGVEGEQRERQEQRDGFVGFRGDERMEGAQSPDIEFVDQRGSKHSFQSGYGTSWDQWPVGSRTSERQSAVAPEKLAILAHVPSAMSAIYPQHVANAASSQPVHR